MAQPLAPHTFRTASLKLAAFSCATLLSSGLASTNASARDARGVPLHVSGGIAAPAAQTAVHTNPAGLVDAPPAIVLSAGAPEVWDDGTYRAGLQTGNSSFGVAAGLEKGIYEGGSDPLAAFYGAGVRAGMLSLGVSARSGISHRGVGPHGEFGSRDDFGTRVSAGALLAVTPSIDLGLTARGINGGVDEWGGGARFGVANGVDLVIDVAGNGDLDGLEAKPGLRVGNDSAAITVAYGTGGREEFSDGFSAGASFRVGNASVFELQYAAGGPFSKYFAALALGF